MIIQELNVIPPQNIIFKYDFDNIEVEYIKISRYT